MNTVIEEYKRKKKRKTIGEYTVRYAVSVVLLAILLFPYLFMVSKSFMSITDINASEIKLFPTKPSFENYLQLGEYFKYFSIRSSSLSSTPCLCRLRVALWRIPSQERGLKEGTRYSH